MKQICLGTLITLLYQGRRRKSDHPRDICAGIFAAYGLDINNFNSGLPSHLKSGHDVTPGELEDAAREMTIDEICDGFKEHVLPLIHDDKRKAVIRAIKDILREDTTITGSTIIGKLPGFEKDNIIKSSSVDEASLIANVVSYAILMTDNKQYQKSIKEINSDYVDSLIKSDDEVHFINPLFNLESSSLLKRTMKDPAFDSVFKQAIAETIPRMSNPTRVCVFYIDPQNCRFKYKSLKDLIINNISNYVYSRASLKQFSDTGTTDRAIGTRAMLKFFNRYGKNAGNVLGEFLLYIFLEQELGAPKIMSKIELDEYDRDVISKCDGVHLLSCDQLGQPFHQLVFGASDIIGDLTTAVDNAFDKIIKIEHNGDNELRMIDSTTQRTIYDPKTTEYMVNLMRPKKGEESIPDMAFGAFLGYTIHLDKPETDSQKYKTAVKNQMIADINAVQPHITELIEKNGLESYSFYFYVLPFNDAPNDKEGIIQDMLTGGGIN